MRKQRGFTFRGRIVVKEDRSGVPGLRVQLYDKDLLMDDRLGATVTDEDGKFLIRYEKKDFRDFLEQAPDLYVKVLDCEGTAVYTSEDSVIWDAGSVVDLDIPLARDTLVAHLKKFRRIPRRPSGSLHPPR